MQIQWIAAGNSLADFPEDDDFIGYIDGMPAWDVEYNDDAEGYDLYEVGVSGIRYYAGTFATTTAAKSHAEQQS